MSLKTRYAGSFDTFPDSYKYTENLAIKDFKATVYKSDYCFWLFLQFVFRKQWFKLKNYVNSLGISIIGDLPLYVAYDSSDVWANPELFKLDEELHPTEVAGVPPDYFSPTGQLWGNPVYNWELMESDGYDWWINRIKKASELYDIIRIDHFRGFDRYFSIPAGSETAETGEWKHGPGLKLFVEIKKRLGDIALIAEDLGVMDYGKAPSAHGLPRYEDYAVCFRRQAEQSVPSRKYRRKLGGVYGYSRQRNRTRTSQQNEREPVQSIQIPPARRS